MTAKALVALILSACAYDTRFEDCTVRCTTDVVCPVGLSCEVEGFCRAPGAMEACAEVLETVPSCVGLAPTCGPNADEDCCSTAEPISGGGTFFRSYDIAADSLYPSMSYPATVSPFVLDRFEVTVGRFRKFVETGLGTQVNPPAASSGAHTKISASGWDEGWNQSLAANTAALVAAVKCNASFQTWTDASGSNEELPINCVTWYEAMAFCAWDGGFLPTEAEWNFAAAGGAEQRAYPWSSPAGSTAVDCSYANYEGCVNPPNGTAARVGGASSKGDARWRHADLAGNVWEWILDEYSVSYMNPCNDCTVVTGTSSSRAMRGGSFYYLDTALSLRTAARHAVAADTRGGGIGIRCARTPLI